MAMVPLMLQPLTFGPPEEEKAHGRISMKTYYQLFRAGGSLLAVLLVAVVFVMGEVGFARQMSQYYIYSLSVLMQGIHPLNHSIFTGDIK